jgi:hypothetical protein
MLLPIVLPRFSPPARSLKVISYPLFYVCRSSFVNGSA